MGTDRYAYLSRLRRVDPVAKVWVALAVLLLCLFSESIAVGLVISSILGYLYALLLNRLKGNEMAVTTYVGYSIVSLMCIGWLILPFQSPELKWPLGDGLRVTLGLQSSYRHLLNDFLSFELFGITIPTGLLLFMALCCLLMWLFMRSKTGIAMSAVGNNPRFAEATGINVDKMRIIGTTLSTMLGAVGIIVYSQSYGFMQLYQAPRQLGFVAASASSSEMAASISSKELYLSRFPASRYSIHMLACPS